MLVLFLLCATLPLAERVTEANKSILFAQGQEAEASKRAQWYTRMSNEKERIKKIIYLLVAGRLTVVVAVAINVINKERKKKIACNRDGISEFWLNEKLR